MHLMAQLRPLSTRLQAVECVCPDETCPYQPSLFPVRSDLPPLIMHLTADARYPSLEAFLTTESRLPLPFLLELVAFGAVYVKLSARSKRAERLLPGTRLDLAVQRGSYARVHVNPRRYPNFYELGEGGWVARVATGHECADEIVVVDKPPGVVPTVPTVDNAVENVVTAVTLAVAASVPGASPASTSTSTSYAAPPLLFATGRLDACTSGVVCFARSADAAKRINDCLKTRAVRKVYRALCLADPRDPSARNLAAGTVRHLFRRKSKAHDNAKPTLLRSFDASLLPDPGAPASEQDLTWQLAELRIIRSRPVVMLPPEASGELGNARAPLRLVEVDIELITGRTHQIRLQMAALNCPLYGDSRYAPVRGLLDDDLDTSPSRGEFGPEPKERVGLHCSALTLPGGTLPGQSDAPLELRASEPWWSALLLPG